jgi:hypothetical protein
MIEFTPESSRCYSLDSVVEAKDAERGDQVACISVGSVGLQMVL